MMFAFVDASSALVQLVVAKAAQDSQAFYEQFEASSFVLFLNNACGV